MYTILVFILLGLSILVLLTIYWSWLNGIAPMPTSSKVKHHLLSTLPAGVRGNIYELGSGWGTLVFPLARQYPYSHVIGYETSPVPYWVSKMWLLITFLPNVTIRRQDFHSISLNDASVIVCYLYPEAMLRLRHKFESELRPGTWVISNTFALPDWTPETVVELDDIYRTKIYLYLIKGPSKSEN
ncbi:MAG: class I SAM-dependent methyltransferase [Parachlamydiaceae bacterium]